jgi:hypothetical protein
MKNVPSIPTIKLPRPEKAEKGSVISVRHAIIAILLASGFSVLGGYQYGKGKGEDTSANNVDTADNGASGISEKNMSFAKNSVDGFGCQGLSDDEIAELGKRIDSDRAQAFCDSIKKKYCLTDEFDIAQLENAALRGYRHEAGIQIDDDSWILKLEDDFGNEEAVEIFEFTKCLPASEKSDDYDSGEDNNETVII